MDGLFENFSRISPRWPRGQRKNIFFRCVRQLNFVELSDGRRPYGPSAPRGARGFDRCSHAELPLNAKTTISGALLHRQILLAILVFFAKTFVESFYTSASVNKFLFTREKRMTFRTNFHLDIFLSRRSIDRIATRTSDSRLLISRMQPLAHIVTSFSQNTNSMIHYSTNTKALQGGLCGGHC